MVLHRPRPNIAGGEQRECPRRRILCDEGKPGPLDDFTEEIRARHVVEQAA